MAEPPVILIDESIVDVGAPIPPNPPDTIVPESAILSWLSGAAESIAQLGPILVKAFNTGVGAIENIAAETGNTDSVRNSLITQFEERTNANIEQMNNVSSVAVPGGNKSGVDIFLSSERLDTPNGVAASIYNVPFDQEVTFSYSITGSSGFQNADSAGIRVLNLDSQDNLQTVLEDTVTGETGFGHNDITSGQSVTESLTAGDYLVMAGATNEESRARIAADYFILDENAPDQEKVDQILKGGIRPIRIVGGAVVIGGGLWLLSRLS